MSDVLFLDFNRNLSNLGIKLSAPGVDITYDVVYSPNYDPRDYLNLDYRYKIACERCSFHQGLDHDLSQFDLVIIVDPEIVFPSDTSQYIEKLKTKFKNNNIISIVSSVADFETVPTNMIEYPWFIALTPRVNTFENSFHPNKPKLFDALLGLNRPHRQEIFNRLQASNLLEKSYVSLLAKEFHNDPTQHLLYYSSDLADLETAQVHDIIKSQGIFNSYTLKTLSQKTADIPLPISMQVPWAIYQKSYYSIVAETMQHGPYHMITEKTAKPLYAKRPFVVFGFSGHLQYLQSLGFKTFSSVIDETYDSISDDAARFSAAFDQVIKLSQMDPVEVYDILHQVLEHNHNLIVDSNHFNSPVEQWLTNHIVKVLI